MKNAARSLVALAVLALVSGKSPAVVGRPQPTVAGAYDAVVMLEFPESLCTATLISPRVLLTAAHCLLWEDSPDFRKAPRRINVWTGPDYKLIGKPNQRDAARLLARGVVAAETSPRWKVNFSSDSVDLGLLLLPPGASRGLRPLPLNQAELALGVKAWIVGYGVNWVPTRPKPGGTLSPKDIPDTVGRKNLGLSVVSALEENYLDLAGDSNICQGDSGGPVLAFLNETFAIIAVQSHTYMGCSPRLGSAARVDTELEWIRKTVERWESSPAVSPPRLRAEGSPELKAPRFD